MGRLRNRRRGGGPAKTLTGLTRTGAANKILANQGGIQNPTVGDISAGKEVVMSLDTDSTTKDVGRYLGAILIEVTYYYAASEIPDTNPIDRLVNWHKEGNNLIAWCNTGTCNARFWVF